MSQTSTPTNLPLSNIRVLDFSHVYQGPVGTQLLADYGADVIKVERPGSGDWSRAWGPFVKDVSLPFANLNRNKRSITVDIKSDEGKAIVRKLVQSADVLVHNFRRGVMEKLEFGYDDMHAINPGLIYASSSGWGDEGPYVDRNRGGHDMMARAEGGWFIDLGEGQAPIPGGISVDYPSGLMLMLGILTALLHRERTGEGQQVTTDLLSVAFHAHAWEGATELNADLVDAPARVGGTEAAINRAFRTRDGAIELSAVFSDNALRDISTAMGLGDLSQQPQFATESLQVENSNELNATLAARFIEKTTDDWITELEPQGVLCARVNTFLDASEDEQVLANNMIVQMQHPRAGKLRVLGTPLRLHRTPPVHDRHAPDLGADSRAILEEAGYDAATIDKLCAEKVIG
jgi:crotonobetainyl-CoA:carnitine CoA-transferase CaiB-like acyl-CoA transferase